MSDTGSGAGDPYTVPYPLIDAQVGNTVRLRVKPAPNADVKTLTAEVYERLSVDDDTEELRCFVEDRYPEELVFRVQAFNTGDERGWMCRVIPLDYYTDRTVHAEYGPDGARTGLYWSNIVSTKINL